MSGYTRYFGSSEILGVHLKYCNYHKFAYYPIFWVTWYQTTFKNELGWDGYWKQCRVAGHWVVPLFTPLYGQKIRKAIFKIFSLRLNLQNRLGGGWFLVMISKPVNLCQSQWREILAKGKGCDGVVDGQGLIVVDTLLFVFPALTSCNKKLPNTFQAKVPAPLSIGTNNK